MKQDQQPTYKIQMREEICYFFSHAYNDVKVLQHSMVTPWCLVFKLGQHFTDELTDKQNKRKRYLIKHFTLILKTPIAQSILHLKLNVIYEKFK